MQRVILWWCVWCTCTLLGALCIELRCLDPLQCLHDYEADNSDGDAYIVEGHKIIISAVEDSILEVDCKGWAALDSPAMPCFTSKFPVVNVLFTNCPPPAAGLSFARSLATLNVTLRRTATEGALSLSSLPSYPPLETTHFAGLADLVELRLLATSTGANNRTLEPPTPFSGFLRGLQSLRKLLVNGVRLPAGELWHLPTSLHEVNLGAIGMERPPDEVLALPELRSLYLHEETLAEFPVPPKLRFLTMDSKNTTFRLESVQVVEYITLFHWSQIRPAPLAQCDALYRMILTSPAVEELPEYWVTLCPRLTGLYITKAMHLTSLPSNLLKNATALKWLALNDGVLETLPVGLMDDLHQLRNLELKNNHLRTLPSGMFVGPRALEILDLSLNLLTSDAVQVIAGLLQLRTLDLDHNFHLGDLCEDRFAYSSLRKLEHLSTLGLFETNVTRICRDWREELTSLTMLDLRKTGISELWYSDLLYKRKHFLTFASVNLMRTSVTSVLYTEDDYMHSQKADTSEAVVYLDKESRLQCDCQMYWARMALYPTNNSTGVSARVLGFHCSNGLELRAVPPEEMVCQANYECREAEMPAACTCTSRPEAGRQRLVRVHCEGAALLHVPRVRAAPGVVYDLLLANNHIAELRLDDLPPIWRELDLRNNSLKVIDERTARALVHSPRRILLAGNPLKCDCSAAPLLLALQSAGNAASDFRVATCEDGSALHIASTNPC